MPAETPRSVLGQVGLSVKFKAVPVLVSQRFHTEFIMHTHLPVVSPDINVWKGNVWGGNTWAGNEFEHNQF